MSESPLEIFDHLEPMLELLRGVAARFRAEGFSDSQARDLAVAVWLQLVRSRPEADPS